MSFRSSFAAFLIFAWPVSAASQPAAAPPTAGWQDGFFVQSADGNYRLVFGLVTQTDGRFTVDDPSPITDTFALRKLRPTITGRLARYFEFKVMPDFGNGTTVVQDMYLDTRFSSAFRVRIGKDKTPVGYELLVGDGNLWFPERALASSLVPDRDIGVQAQGDFFAQRLAYSAGLFNGVPDGASSSTDADANGGKDFAGRVVVQRLRGFGFHLGVSTGKQLGPLPSFRTSVGQTYFAYAPGTTASGVRHRLSPAAFYFYRSFGAFAEYMRSTQHVLRSGVTREVVNDAYEVSGSFFVTGEPASTGLIRPARPFDPDSGRWGALQLLARYTKLRVDRDAFTFALTAPGASRRAESFTLAVNWFPTSFVKWYATYERTVFDGDPDGPRPAENAIVFRAQLAF